MALLRVKAAAEQLTLSEAKVYRLVEAGKISFVRIDNGIRFKQEHIDNFIEACTHEAPEQTPVVDEPKTSLKVGNFRILRSRGYDPLKAGQA